MSVSWNSIINPSVYMPTPRGVSVGDTGRFGVLNKISRQEIEYSQDSENVVAETWNATYRSAIEYVSEMAIGREEYMVFKLKPSVYNDDLSINFILEGELLVAKTKEVVIPEFIYRGNIPVEWRCGHCQMPNPMEATYCGEKHTHAVGCGAPRARLIQELFNQYY